MSGRSLENLTFRDKLRDTVHISRELVEHMTQGFMPKVAELQHRSKPPTPSTEDFIPDVTVRNLAAAVLESEQFTASIDDRLMAYCDSLQREVDGILQGG